MSALARSAAAAVMRQKPGARHTSSAPVAAIRDRLAGSPRAPVRLRPAAPAPLADEALARPAARTDRYGAFDQLSWFNASNATPEAPMPAVRAFENAVKAGSDAQALDSLNLVRSINPTAITMVSKPTISHLIKRIVGPEPPLLFASSSPSAAPLNVLPFAGLVGAHRARAVERAREDLVTIVASASGPSIDLDTDLLAMRSARFYPIDMLNASIKTFQTLSGKSTTKPNLDSQESQQQQQPQSPPSYKTEFIEHIQRMNAERRGDTAACRALVDEFAGVFAAAGHVDMCKEMIATMLKTDTSPGIPLFLRLIEAYSRVGDMASAETLAERVMTRGSRSEAIRAAELLLSGYSRAGNITKSNKYFNLCVKMDKETGHSTDNGSSSNNIVNKSMRSPVSTTMTHNMLLRAYCQRGLPGDVDAGYAHMRRKGVDADTETYLQLVRVHGRGRDLKSAVRMFYEGERISSSFAPSIEMQSALVESYMLSGEVQLAWRVLASLLDPPKLESERKIRRYIGGPRSIRDPTEQQHRAAVARLPVSLLSAEMVAPLAKDLSGKPIDYFRDQLKLTQMPNDIRPTVVAQLMQAALRDDVYGPADPNLVEMLYTQYSRDAGCAATAVIPPAANTAMIEALGMLGKTDEAVTLFESTVDDAVVAGEASQAYAAIMNALSRKQGGNASAADLSLKFVLKMQSQSVSMNVGVLEQLAAVVESAGGETRRVFDRVVADAVDRLDVVPVPGRHPRLTALVGKDVVSRVCGLIA